MNEYERSLGFKPTKAQRDYLRNLPNDQLPLISVVVPSYNQGRFIRDCIESVYAQNYPRMEIFVSDGGSKDETVSILEELVAAHGPTLRYDSQPDGGQGPGVNKGIANTKGDVIAWINSDDMYAPDAFWNVATFFVFNSTALIVYGNNDYVKENGDFFVPYPVDWSPLLSEQRKRMFHFCLVPQPSLFFKRHAVTLCGGLMHKMLDYELWLRWQKDLPFYFMDEKLSYSRLQSEAITVNAGHDLLSSINKLVRDYHQLVPMSWCIREIHNRHYGAEWTDGKNSPFTPEMRKEAEKLWRQYNVWDQPGTYLRLRIAEPQRIQDARKEAP